MTNEEIIKANTVDIHGKSYLTVAGRVQLAHEGGKLTDVQTEVLSHTPIVIKATVMVDGKTFTGISSVDPKTASSIEKQSPYEVAETSAVGRALGFANYGLTDSIASADEVAKAVTAKAPVEAPVTPQRVSQLEQDVEDILNNDVPAIAESGAYCKIHDREMKERRDLNGHYWDHRRKNDAGQWEQCNGVDGWKISN